jgi:adenylate kinase
METRTIFFVGKPGSGKGTQAKLLSEKTGWTVISSGDLFRALCKEDTPLGRKVKVENDAGLLQPHWLAMYLFLKSLFGLGGDQSIIFDGFNRKVHEAELVVDALGWLGRSFTVVHIIVSDDEVRKRLAKRRETDGRADDHVIEERLQEYRAHTEEAIAIFRRANTLIEINGEQSPEKITEDVKKALGIA